MGKKRGGKRNKKSGYQIRIVFRLIYCEDQAGIHDIQKKIGDAAAAFSADKADAAAENPHKQNNQHFEQLAYDQQKHMKITFLQNLALQ